MVRAECSRLGRRIRQRSLVIVHEHLPDQNLTREFRLLGLLVMRSRRPVILVPRMKTIR
jgi:hypothetical protein